MPNPIHHTFGPHVDRSFLGKTVALSYVPWRYVRGTSCYRLKEALRERFRGEPALFASGRQALLALLRALDVRPGHEVIVQGYTCVVVPNAIHAAGAVPVYADIDRETLNLTVESVEACITPRTKAVICQHTFGIPAPVRALRELCDKQGIALIEDMAHAIPDSRGPADIGVHGEYLLLSFGRDKAVSGVEGGAVLSRNPAVSRKLNEMERTALHRKWWEVARLLEYPTRMHGIVRPLSGTALFRPAVWIMQRLGLIAPVLTMAEKRGSMSPLLWKLPNVCASLALSELKRLTAINDRRRTLTDFYLRFGRDHRWPMLKGVTSDLPLQKFPLFVHDAEKKRRWLKRENIHLNDGWTGCVVCPVTCNLNNAGYQWGSDPEAEATSEQILSLPTHPTMTMAQALRLAKRVDELLKEEKGI
ncbi:MAG: DegT/DnrJ/EryC1/StrS aminotransferase family protein [Candidatus Peribacteraceae bacterium]|nr:DegT/DnrJ/EryC1/StrS aminotransferase family protein [Candidatus Peribacteraceae bacterium]